MSVGPVSGVLVRASTRILPAGAVRERYRREFLADLAVCTRGAQIRFALGVLSTIVFLRAVVAGAELLVTPGDVPEFPERRPLLCRLRLHRWGVCYNADGEEYLRCRRCGEDHFDLDRTRDPYNVAGNIFGSSFNGGVM
jgi:hypothetical protein